MAKAVIIWLAAAAMVLAATACKKEAAEEGAGPPETAGAAAEVKPPNVAGTFYPAEAEALRAEVEARLGEGEATLAAENVVALLTPHAGYAYSGGVAATAFREVRGRRPATVVLLGPSHHCARPEIATATYDGYETPLGVVDVDDEFVAAVEEKCSEVAYTDVPFAQEHCLEVQLPFVQTLFPEAKVAPFIFCRHDRGAAEHFGEALAEVIAAREAETLLVVTCDLSHYHPYAEAVRLDRAFVAAFETFDVAALYEGADAGRFEIDAVGAVAAAFRCARELGAARATVLEYKNSGDVTGDVSRGVVGYAAAAVIK